MHDHEKPLSSLLRGFFAFRLRRARSAGEDYSLLKNRADSGSRCATTPYAVAKSPRGTCFPACITLRFRAFMGSPAPAAGAHQCRPQLVLALRPRSVADFYRHYRALLREAGIAVKLWPVPVEVADVPPFAEDQHHHSYDAAAAEQFWDVLLRADQVLNEFRGRFRGKCSPVHFFWGSFDLAVTRFSGRPAPPHPGGLPHLADWVTRESYSAEQCAAGWWPGGNGQEAAFYSYAYPGIPELAEAAIRPAQAVYNNDEGEFFLPYEAARNAADPAQAVLSFLQSTYEAAANLAHWDRAALERP